MSETKSNRTCPNCGTGVLRHISYDDGVVWLCGNCNLQWAELGHAGGFMPLDLRSPVHQRYMEASKFDASSYAPYKRFWTKIESVLGRKPKRVLDIGCGNGVFVGDGIKRGYEVLGVDADPSNKVMIDPEVLPYVEFIRAEHLEDRGVRYDVITFWDSFEHMEKPFELLEDLRDLLAPDGVVFLRVNDQRDIFNIVTMIALKIAPGFGRRMFHLCFNLPYHYWNFTRTVMPAMLEKRGWQVISARSTETPATRFFQNWMLITLAKLAYCVNWAIGGGKIREYFLKAEARD